MARLKKYIIAGLVSLLVFSGTVFAEDLSEAPVKVQAAVLIKVLGFSKTLKDDVTIYVIGNDGFAKEMKANVGKSIGSDKMLAAVESGNDLPADKPSILYVGDESQIAAATAYARDNAVLTIGAKPGLVSKGASMGIGIAGGKPKILLNPEASKAEGMDWNPAIMKLAIIQN